MTYVVNGGVGTALPDEYAGSPVIPEHPTEAELVAALALKQGLDEDLTNLAAVSNTAAGRSLLDDATVSDILTTLGLSSNGKSLVSAADYAAMQALLGIVPSGAAFPGSPVNGQRFFNTTLKRQYEYDGTRWLSTELFEHFLGTSSPAGIVVTSNYMTTIPLFGTHSLWLDSWSGFCQRNATGEWDLVLNYRTAAGALVAIDTRDGSADVNGTWHAFSRALNVALHADARAFSFVPTEAVDGATCVCGASVFYKLIGV